MPGRGATDGGSGRMGGPLRRRTARRPRRPASIRCRRTGRRRRRGRGGCSRARRARDRARRTVIGTSGWAACTARDALGRGDEADEAQPRAPASLQPADRAVALPPVASIGSTTNDLGVGHAGGQRLVVADGRSALLVAVHAEVADARLGHQAQEAVDHAEPGAQDRDDHDLGAPGRRPSVPRAACRPWTSATVAGRASPRRRASPDASPSARAEGLARGRRGAQLGDGAAAAGGRRRCSRLHAG